MASVLLQISALLFSAFLLLAGNSLQFVILGLRADFAGFSTLAIGAITASYYIGFGLGTLAAPGLVARLGHIRAFALVGALVSANVLAHGLWVNEIFWILLRFATGLAFALLATVFDAWLNAKATRNIRGQVLAIATIVVSLGYAIGPLLTAFGSIDGYILFIVASMLISVAVVPVVTSRIPPPSPTGGADTVENYSILRLGRETPLGLVGTMVIGGIQGAFLGLGAVFCLRLGYTTEGASYFVTASLVFGMLAQYPLGFFSDRMDRRRVIAAITLCLSGGGALCAFLIWTVGAPVWVMGLTAAVCGIAAMPIYPLFVAFANDRLPETSIVPAAAALVLSFSIGSAISGAAASSLMGYLGPVGLIIFVTAGLLFTGLFTLYRMRVREEVEAEAPDPLTTVVLSDEETQTSWYESSVFAAPTGLIPTDWAPEEEQLEFNFDAPLETSENESAAA